jgi:D-glycero-D-manno-heptose 1,7-bisphosphate phosphatase
MPYIILDRDGVINHDSVDYIKSPEEWVAIPGSLEAIAHLNRAGFHVLIATNQSGVGRGYYDLATLDEIHEKLTHELATVGGCIDGIFFCPHQPDEGCDCRKPKPGMLLQMKEKFNLDLTQIFFIGDSHVDIQAALTAGCKPLLVMTGNGERTLTRHPEFSSIPRFETLMQAAEYVIHEGNHHEKN